MAGLHCATTTLGCKRWGTCEYRWATGPVASEHECMIRYRVSSKQPIELAAEVPKQESAWDMADTAATHRDALPMGSRQRRAFSGPRDWLLTYPQNARYKKK